MGRKKNKKTLENKIPIQPKKIKSQCPLVPQFILIYDKQDVALSVIMQKMAEHTTKLIIKAMSEREEKLIDLVKDISVKCDDIKSDTELIKEYTSQIEEIFDKTEEFLKDHLSSDWEKIKDYIVKHTKNGSLSKFIL